MVLGYYIKVPVYPIFYLLKGDSNPKPHQQEPPGVRQTLLGGSWDLVTIYNWGYNPTYNWGNPCKAI